MTPPNGNKEHKPLFNGFFFSALILYHTDPAGATDFAAT
jgi:hypothetical protein